MKNSKIEVVESFQDNDVGGEGGEYHESIECNFNFFLFIFMFILLLRILRRKRNLLQRF